ncbi:MAG: RagB/SusD family nutrient uptake outer membrane protein [Porphyromonadaceae bacterium]|nr:MAG: RagB/SusD family nutrient uptake outer membrane protein [Porphyromonadaceae bacterium]
MKRIFQTILTTVILLGILSSCEKFLSLAPVSQANTEDFYKTPADLDNAVIAAYKYQKYIFSNDFCSQHLLDEQRSDNTGYSNLTDEVDNFTKDTGKEWYMWSWDKCYKAIYTCNVAIEKAVGITMSDELMNQYLGELRFLRAITYFELVRNYGGVPLVLETPKSLDRDAINVSRNTVSEVYDQIVADLQFAEANLPVSYIDGKYIGRATKGAANGYLGKVYLTLGKKSEAEAALRKVLTYGYELLPQYADVFEANNGNNKEVVFELQFKSTTDACPFIYIFTSMQVDVKPGLGYNKGTQDLFDAFEAGDPRRDLTMAKDNVGLYYCVKYKDPAANPVSDANNNIPLMRYSEVLLLLAESLGETSESYNLINQVRSRVGLANISSSTPGTFAQKLLHERRVELAYENHRWHDLLRFGVAIEVMNAFFVKEKNGAITIGPDDLLFPIPNFTLLNNPNLVQNPGYPGS